MLGCVIGVVVAGGIAALVGNITPMNGFNMPEAENLLLYGADKGMKISGPVSYTHLDVYKRQGVMYSASFGVTLIALSLITTLLIMTVVSNIVLSLGMVGALSIVRFRTAIKEPMDIAFLFWAIAVGIVLAAGLIPLAVFRCV